MGIYSLCLSPPEGRYVQELIYGLDAHQKLLNLVGEERLKSIKADPETGYASGLDRR
jgi:glutaconate CoA-transferase, subunit A